MFFDYFHFVNISKHFLRTLFRWECKINEMCTQELVDNGSWRARCGHRGKGRLALQTDSSLSDAEASDQCLSLRASGSPQCQSDPVDVNKNDHRGGIKKKEGNRLSRWPWRQTGVWHLVVQSSLLCWFLLCRKRHMQRNLREGSDLVNTCLSISTSQGRYSEMSPLHVKDLSLRQVFFEQKVYRYLYIGSIISNLCRGGVFTLFSHEPPCTWAQNVNNRASLRWRSCKYWWMMTTKKVMFIKQTGYTIRQFWQSILFWIMKLNVLSLYELRASKRFF